MTQDAMNVALKCPKNPLVRASLGNLRATFFVREMLEVFCFRGWKLSRGLYNRSNFWEWRCGGFWQQKFCRCFPSNTMLKMCQRQVHQSLQSEERNLSPRLSSHSRIRILCNSTQLLASPRKKELWLSLAHFGAAFPIFRRFLGSSRAKS